MTSTEAETIGRTTRPATVQSLTTELRELGLAPGDTVVVHSSLSALGWVCGGPQAVVMALLAAVGSEGSIIMPTQTAQLSDPADWTQPPVPDEWVEAVRNGLPAYDRDLTPSRAMGAVVECFRHVPGVVRSDHPLVSFAGVGRRAARILADHPLSPALGDESPLGRLYAADGRVLLLGVGHENNTSLHLAEHRADWPTKAERIDGAPMMVDGERRWVSYRDLDHDDGDFPMIGGAFADSGGEIVGPVGATTARLMSMRSIVDFAVEWIEEHR